jgi:hypothetical protein
MPVRKGRPLTFKAKGLSDAIDGSNAFPGSMQSLQNLIPNPSTSQQFVPRPAIVALVELGGSDPLLDSNGNPLLDSNGNIIYAVAGSFTAPDIVEALYVVGSRIYGMVQTGRYAGNSEPFCYDAVAGSFVTIGNVTAANTPVSTNNTGDWTPPQMDMIANKILITHPGYDGVTHFIGWIDVSGFSYTGAVTGATHGNTTIDTLSASAFTLGWSVGQLIQTSAGDLPAGTYITGINAAGTAVTISQAATGSHAGVTFTVTGGTMAAPLYGSGQVSGAFPLPAVPVAVSQFNGRAYLAVNNGVTFSDALQPLQFTGAGGTFVPALTMGDSTSVTAIGGVPLANQVIGGTIQSLIVFKGSGGYWQVTGDPSSTASPLESNFVNGSVGTLAPNTITPTPIGVAYVAPDGVRIIGLNGQSSAPIGADGQGVSVPFQYAISPTRMTAAYNQNVLRITVQNGAVNGEPYQEYWYDMNLTIWTGPHTSVAALNAAIYSPVNSFIMTQPGVDGFIYESSALPSANSTYVENGVAMTFTWQTSLLPDNEAMAANSSPRGAIGLSMPGGISVTVIGTNELGTVIGSAVIAAPGAGGSVWDAFDWGSATWGAAVTPYRQYGLHWSQSLIFKQASLLVAGQSAAGFVIGNANLEYVELGYLGAGFNAAGIAA